MMKVAIAATNDGCILGFRSGGVMPWDVERAEACACLPQYLTKKPQNSRCRRRSMVPDLAIDPTAGNTTSNAVADLELAHRCASRVVKTAQNGTFRPLEIVPMNAGSKGVSGVTP